MVAQATAPGSSTATIHEEIEMADGPEYPTREMAAQVSPPLRSPAESVVRVNPFDTPLSPTPNRTPYRTPNRSRRPSLSDRPSFGEFMGGSDYTGRSSARVGAGNTFFRSRRIRKEDLQTPREANTHKDPKAKWTWILPLIGMGIGLAISGVLIYLALRQVGSSHNYCSVLNEDFSSGKLNPNIWTIERQVGGFGYVPSPQSSRHVMRTLIRPPLAMVNSRRPLIRPTRSLSAMGSFTSSPPCRMRA